VAATFGDCNLCNNAALTSISLPVAATFGDCNLSNNATLTSISLPLAATFRDCNLCSNAALTSVSLPLAATFRDDNLSWNAALTSAHIGKQKLSVKNVDGYCFVIEYSRASKGIKIYEGFNIGKMADGILAKEPLYVAEKDGFTAHGTTPKQAIQDLNFKIVAEKLKSEPITLDTELTVLHYRTITGACDIGVRQWMQDNNIPFKVEKDGKGNDRTVEVAPIKAKDVLPILRKTNAYGLQKLESLLK
jgi:hypothetical protein